MQITKKHVVTHYNTVSRKTLTELWCRSPRNKW